MPPRRKPSRLAYTISETAARLNVSPTTVRRMIARGDLRSFHAGRSHRVPAAEIDRFLRDGSR